jgi:predicted RNA-binding Zn-ribbon protein involved in translation (DUF1610 family)
MPLNIPCPKFLACMNEISRKSVTSAKHFIDYEIVFKCPQCDHEEIKGKQGRDVDYVF